MITEDEIESSNDHAIKVKWSDEITSRPPNISVYGMPDSLIRTLEETQLTNISPPSR